MHIHTIGRVLAAAAVLTTGAARAQATTVALPAAADATLYEDPSGSLANGAGSHLFAGQTGGFGARRTVLRFDVAAAVPAGALVVAAELELNVNRTIFASPLQVDLHRVISAWNEGTTAAPGQEGGGGAAAPGDVTWLHTNQPLLWNRPGGDFDPQKAASSLTPTSGAAVWTSTTAMVAHVQDWLDSPATNFGWLLKTDELTFTAVRRFDSRTGLVAARRPVLRVTYILPGQWASVGAGCGQPAPTLQVTGSPATGSSFALLLVGAVPGAIATNFAGPVLQQPGFELAPGCNFLLDPLITVNLGLATLDGSGQLINGFTVPVVPSFAGMTFAAQGGVADPGSPNGFGLSNAVLAWIQ